MMEIIAIQMCAAKRSGSRSNRGSGSNRTESAFQILNGHGLLAEDKCTGLCTLNPSKTQAFGKLSAIYIKGRFSALRS